MLTHDIIIKMVRIDLKMMLERQQEIWKEFGEK